MLPGNPFLGFEKVAQCTLAEKRVTCALATADCSPLWQAKDLSKLTEG